jgi:hypothetical protein
VIARLGARLARALGGSDRSTLDLKILERRNELARLHAEQGERISLPAAPELIEHSGRRAIWRVIVPDQHDRYMCARRYPYGNDTFIVQVDAEVFYRYWLSSDAACVPRAAMPSDRKFADAAKGFSHGKDNPVPLANPCIRLHGAAPRISFSNGITRTFWLLAHRVPAFPVEVYHRDVAELLNQIAGLGVPTLSNTTLFAGLQSK